MRTVHWPLAPPVDAIHFKHDPVPCLNPARRLLLDTWLRSAPRFASVPSESSLALARKPPSESQPLLPCIPRCVYDHRRRSPISGRAMHSAATSCGSCTHGSGVLGATRLAGKGRSRYCTLCCVYLTCRRQRTTTKRCALRPPALRCVNAGPTATKSYS